MVWAKDVPFGNHNNKNFYLAVTPQNSLILGREWGFPAKMLSRITSEQLNRFQSSIAQTMKLPDRSSAPEVKKLKFALGELLLKNSPEGNFPAKKKNVLITFERMKKDENCHRAIYWKSWSGNRTVTSVPV
jgi:hypothetical protein